MILLIVCITSVGCIPVAVSPLSINASAPSRTALATSVISLLFGFIRSIILSIICVATITGLARCIHLRIISFCINGTFSTGSSTPRSPRAIIIASLSRIISRIFCTACGFSILAITFAVLFLFLRIFFNPCISSTSRTKESAIQSTFCPIIKSRSSKSFSVKAGRETLVSGRFNPFFEDKMPPITTSTSTLLFGRILVTFTSSFPSSIIIRFPMATSLYKSL